MYVVHALENHSLVFQFLPHCNTCMDTDIQIEMTLHKGILFKGLQCFDECQYQTLHIQTDTRLYKSTKEEILIEAAASNCL